MALQSAGKGIRVNAVDPGVVPTRLHLRSAMVEAASTRFLERNRTAHLLGRVGRPEETARRVAFSASGLAGWITGIFRSMDGGRVWAYAR